MSSSEQEEKPQAEGGEAEDAPQKEVAAAAEPEAEPKAEPKAEAGEEREQPAGEKTEATVEVVLEEEEEYEKEEPDDGIPRVLVTGASGYIGSHLTKALLEEGRFRIRGSVRNTKKKEKVQPLLDLAPNSKYPLRLVKADLQKAESWAEAVKTCSYVYHVASPFPPPGKNPPPEEVITPALNGTLNVLKAVAEAGTIKRVVLTSSVAAISCGMSGSPDKPPDHIYTEEDWSVEEGCAVYERSKLLAERAAWDFVSKLDDDKKFELVVVNPAYVQGPLLSTASGAASMTLCKNLLTGKMPAVPDISMIIVDVRDVVKAHMAAMEKPEAAGNRYALVTGSMNVRDMAQAMNAEFKPQGFTKIPSLHAPKFLVWMFKFFDSSVKDIYPMVGKTIRYNNKKMVEGLGVTPYDMRETIIDTCYSLIEMGEVPKTARYQGPPSTRPVPPPAPEPAQEQPAAPEPKPESAQEQPAAEPEPKPAQEQPPEPEPEPAQEQQPAAEPEPEPAKEQPPPEPEPEPAKTEGQPPAEPEPAKEDEPTES